MRDENVERSPQGEPKRSSRIAENQVYMFQIYQPEETNKNILISELAQQVKNPAPEGAKSIYVDHEEIEYKSYEKHRILVIQIISARCEVLKFGYDNLGLVGEQMRNDVKPSVATPSHTASYREPPALELSGTKLRSSLEIQRRGLDSWRRKTCLRICAFHMAGNI